ncbi:MAG: heme-binding protein [Burkholderiales bacterium]
MKLKFCTIVAITVALAAPATAQKMLATTSSLTTTAALTAAQAALAQCQKDGATVAVAVVDRAGTPLALLRDNLAGTHTVRTALDKGWTAVSFRVATGELAEITQAGKPMSGIRALPNVVAAGGGVPIRAKGAIVGGIGVSGAPNGEADEACANAGIKAVSDALELE